MTNEELIVTMDKTEVVFRVLTQERGGCKVHCLKCAYWETDAHGQWHCTAPEEEENCRKVFEAWLKTEAE